MANESTNQQLRSFIEKAIKDAQNPDMRKLLKRQREKKKKIIASRFGL